MILQIVKYIAALSVAIVLIPAGAHVLELPAKIHMSAADYRTVQVIYRGWALSGFVIALALLSTLALSILEWRTRAFAPAVVAFLCIAATQVIFWSVTFPVNQLTANWTLLPDHWATLRDRWEYSHAASSFFNLAALCAIIGALLAAEPNR